jgi:hypothetical protein
MTVALELKAVAELAGVSPANVKPSVFVTTVRKTSGGNDVTYPLTVPPKTIFVATHVDADSFLLDGSNNPIFGTRQKNPPYGDVLQLFWTHAGQQQQPSGATPMRAFLGDVFLLFRSGETIFTVESSENYGALTPPVAAYKVWLTFVFRGFLVPDSALLKLSGYEQRLL